MNKKNKVTGTWWDDPAHFRRSSRRSFLYSGLVGGLGLTLGDFFAMRAQAGPAPVGVGAKFGQAKSIIHIFLPGGMAAQETFWSSAPR